MVMMNPAHERDAALASLDAATARLLPLINPALVPREGMSFGLSLRVARDCNGIAAITGGIHAGAEGRMTAGPAAFGTADPVVRVLLTVTKFDASLRSAAILQFSDRAFRVLRDDLFLEYARADRTLQNSGIDTMDWAIAACCREGIPDVIVRKDMNGNDTFLILTGESPTDVTNNIIICSNRI